MSEGRDRDAAEVDPVEIHVYSIGSNAGARYAHAYGV